MMQEDLARLRVFKRLAEEDRVRFIKVERPKMIKELDDDIAEHTKLINYANERTEEVIKCPCCQRSVNRHTFLRGLTKKINRLKELRALCTS